MLFAGCIKNTKTFLASVYIFKVSPIFTIIVKKEFRIYCYTSGSIPVDTYLFVDTIKRFEFVKIANGVSETLYLIKTSRKR